MWQTKVREWLKQNDRTQAWLARKADISESYFSFILNGYKPVSEAYLTNLEKVMGVEPHTLVGLKESANGVPKGSDGVREGEDKGERDA